MLKRITAMAAVLVLLLSTLSVGAAEETATFSWWISKNEDTSYYDNYRQNPVVDYVLSTNTFQGKKVDIAFSSGIPGSEKENFSNMLATESLTDVFDLSYSDYNTSSLYEDGYILDLTELIPQYMPNYYSLIESNPVYASFAYSYVDGEKRLLSIIGLYETTKEIFEGYLYRRDWVAKYGKNPVTGEAFEYSYDENGNLTDNVVFPSGEAYPKYLSDWEWMFEIFIAAMTDLGITDGYCMSIYYEGYQSTGDFNCAFGGGSPFWYRKADHTVGFDLTTEAFRTYLECMSGWYQKGWIDPAFAQRSSDMFYTINSTAVHQGKVGLWQGRQSEVGAQMLVSGETDGIYVAGAPQPINDIYGSEDLRNQTPYAFYAFPPVSSGVAINKKAENKDLPALFSFIDYFFSQDGGRTGSVGFSRQQMESFDPESSWVQTYRKFGLDEGFYDEEIRDDGVVSVHFNKPNEELLRNAMKANRFPLFDYNGHFIWEEIARSKALTEALELWMMYDNTGYIYENVEKLISTKDFSRLSKVKNNIRTYAAQTVPKFIMGQLDWQSDKDWGDFVKTVEKYGVDKVNQIYQQAFDEMAR